MINYSPQNLRNFSAAEITETLKEAAYRKALGNYAAYKGNKGSAVYKTPYGQVVCLAIKEGEKESFEWSVAFQHRTVRDVTIRKATDHVDFLNNY